MLSLAQGSIVQRCLSKGIGMRHAVNTCSQAVESAKWPVKSRQVLHEIHIKSAARQGQKLQLRLQQLGRTRHGAQVVTKRQWPSCGVANFTSFASWGSSCLLYDCACANMLFIQAALMLRLDAQAGNQRP